MLPEPFRGMGAWQKTIEPHKPGNSSRGWNRDRKETKSPKSERHEMSIARQCGRRLEVSWVRQPQALHEGSSILPIL